MILPSVIIKCGYISRVLFVWCLITLSLRLCKMKTECTSIKLYWQNVNLVQVAVLLCVSFCYLVTRLRKQLP